MLLHRQLCPLSVRDYLPRAPSIGVPILVFVNHWAHCCISGSDGSQALDAESIQLLKLFAVQGALDEHELAPLISEVAYLVR